MTPLQIALRYMELLHAIRAGRLNAEELYSVCASDMQFITSAYQLNSAKEYIELLKINEPKPFSFSLLYSFENTDSATLVYYFSQENIRAYMSQTFEVKGEKIISTILIYDSAVFVEKK